MNTDLPNGEKKVFKMKQTQIQLKLAGREIILLGTAHVSEESVKEVSDAINEIKPDCVAIELDEKRCEAIKNPEKYRQLDIVSVLKKGEGFLLLANLVLSTFQRRMGKNIGVKPGDEMVSAMKTAEQNNIPAVMADRPIQVTLRRAWAKNSFFGKFKLLGALLSSAFSKEEVSQEQIEGLKDRSEMDSMMSELSEYLPKVKEVLIDERDKYLASHIWKSEGNKILAVLGAGHLPGVQAHLEKIAAGTESSDTEGISVVPPKKMGAKIAGWIIPTIIVGLIVLGFVIGGQKIGSKMALSWFLWNAIPASIGTAIAAGHPLAILAGFVAAPFTSLCPFIGVGVVTGISQAILCKPKVQDMEKLSDDASSIRGFYKNRLLRVLLVFVLSSIGSSIGTFVGGADVAAKFTEAFNQTENLPQMPINE